ncbi:MAG: AAA family ATPase [Desulfatibacillaceae bacterium]
MTNVDAAIQWVKRGGIVFPAWWDGKQHRGYLKWSRSSGYTGNPDKVRKWAKQWPNAYFCCHLGISGHAVLDVDDKDGKSGSETLNALFFKECAVPPTLAVKTPSGGRHYFFEGTCRNSAGKLGVGLDTRGAGGMVPVPGSFVIGKGEYKILNDLPIRDLPAWIKDRAGEPRIKDPKTDTPLCELDLPHNIEAAKRWLKEDAPEAVEGDGGDQTTYQVACHLVRDLALTPETAFDLLCDWNSEKAYPPWELEDLQVKIANANAYGQGQIGAGTPDSMFGPPAASQDASSGKTEKRGFQFISVEELLSGPKPVDWLVSGYLEAGCLAEIFGDAGSMKSFLALDISLSIATGSDWHGHKVKRGAVFYIAGEGFTGFGRRVKAWEIGHQKSLSGAPFFLSTGAASFLDNGGAAEVGKAADDLARKHGSPNLIVVDTVARNFGPGDENATIDMSSFVSIMDALRTRFGAAVLLIHHTGQSDKGRARGAYALKAALDFEYRLEVQGTTRVLTCTKPKDFEDPDSLVFQPETVVLPGWQDRNDQFATSVVLRRQEGVLPVQDCRQSLTGAKKVCLDSLYEALKEKGEDRRGRREVHIEHWRQASYRNGISRSEDQHSKKKAFRRALTGLLDSSYVETSDDYYWPKGTGDGTGTCEGHVPGPEGDKGDTPL